MDSPARTAKPNPSGAAVTSLAHRYQELGAPHFDKQNEAGVRSTLLLVLPIGPLNIRLHLWLLEKKEESASHHELLLFKWNLQDAPLIAMHFAGLSLIRSAPEKGDIFEIQDFIDFSWF